MQVFVGANTEILISILDDLFFFQEEHYNFQIISLLTTKKDEEDIFHFNSSGLLPNELPSMVFATKLPWYWTLRNSLQR